MGGGVKVSMSKSRHGGVKVEMSKSSHGGVNDVI